MYLGSLRLLVLGVCDESCAVVCADVTCISLSTNNRKCLEVASYLFGCFPFFYFLVSRKFHGKWGDKLQSLSLGQGGQNCLFSTLRIIRCSALQAWSSLFTRGDAISLNLLFLPKSVIWLRF